MVRNNLEHRFYRAIGERIRQLREGRFTQLDLARLLGVSRTSITNLESGNQRFPAHLLLRLARHLGCQPSDLLPNIHELDGEVTEDLPDTMRLVVPSTAQVTERTADVIKQYTQTRETRER